MMQKPKMMLADEPVASLDPALSHTIMDYLKDLNKNDGITVVCSLHFLSLAREYGDRIIALKAGEIVFDGSPSLIDEARFMEIYGDRSGGGRNPMSLYNKYRPRRSFGHTLLRWVMIVVGIVIFAIGWQVTEINFKDLITGFNDVQPLLNSLLHPEFVTKESKKFTSTSLIQIPCTDNPPPQTPPNPDGYMIVSETCVSRGEVIGVQGLNYPSRIQVTLSLAAVDNPRRDRLAVVLTDINGEFTTDLTNSGGLHLQVRRAGAPATGGVRDRVWPATDLRNDQGRL